MHKLGSIAQKIKEKWRQKQIKDPKYNPAFHNYQTGILNDYQYRPDQYSTVTGQTCTNNLEFDGIIYGKFMCPVEGYDLSSTYCCGKSNEQYCCTLQEKQQENPEYKSGGSLYDEQYTNPNPKDQSVWLMVLVYIIPPVLLFSCIGVAICMFCKKERIYERIKRPAN